jgi:hypothetical protein
MPPFNSPAPDVPIYLLVNESGKTRIALRLAAISESGKRVREKDEITPRDQAWLKLKTKSPHTKGH